MEFKYVICFLRRLILGTQEKLRQCKRVVNWMFQLYFLVWGLFLGIASWRASSWLTGVRPVMAARHLERRDARKGIAMATVGGAFLKWGRVFQERGRRVIRIDALFFAAPSYFFRFSKFGKKLLHSASAHLHLHLHLHTLYMSHLYLPSLTFTFSIYLFLVNLHKKYYM